MAALPRTALAEWRGHRAPDRPSKRRVLPKRRYRRRRSGGGFAFPGARASEDIGGVVAGDAVRARPVVAAQRAVREPVESRNGPTADLAAQVHGGGHDVVERV